MDIHTHTCLLLHLNPLIRLRRSPHTTVCTHLGKCLEDTNTQSSPQCGRFQAILGNIRTNLARLWSTSARIWPSSARALPTPPKLSRCWPNLDEHVADVEPELDRIGSTWSYFVGPTSTGRVAERSRLLPQTSPGPRPRTFFDRPIVHGPDRLETSEANSSAEIRARATEHRPNPSLERPCFRPRFLEPFLDHF